MNILKTIRQNLCIGCGTCVVVCPKNALEIIENDKNGVYIPKINNKKCSQCGICIAVCPGINTEQNEVLATCENSDVYIGKFLKCYAGYATDSDLRYAASSGGLITALTILSLEIGLVDGVLATQMNRDNPLKPTSFIARNKNDLISAMGSKYCPIPVNLQLKNIFTDKRNYMVVGLPCQILGAKRAKEIMGKSSGNTIFLGLSCNHTPTFNATRYLLQSKGISENSVTNINYRWKNKEQKEFDFGLKVTTNSNEKYIPSNDALYWGLVFSKFFWPSRCIICEDKLCECSDITFMDAWLPEFSSDPKGTSLIIVRSKKGKELIDIAIQRNIIKLVEVPPEKVAKAQLMKEITENRIAAKFVYRFLYHTRVPSSKGTSKPRILSIIKAILFIQLNRLCQSNNFLTRAIIKACIVVLKFKKKLKK